MESLIFFCLEALVVTSASHLGTAALDSNRQKGLGFVDHHERVLALPYYEN